MRRAAFHFVAGLGGALVFGAPTALYCGQTPPFVAAAPVVIRSAAKPAATIDLDSVRLLLATEPVLRRAALQPEAAAFVERNARPSWFERLIMLGASRPGDLDTLARAVAMLGPRVGAQPGPWPDTVEITAAMASGPEAAAVATAVAEAFVEEIRETSLADRKRGLDQRARRLAAAQQHLDKARDRAQALRIADPLPTASTASPTAAIATGTPESLRRAAAEAESRLAEAIRVYGPRHPALIERQAETRRARMALAAARNVARTPAPTNPEGGPDPRAAELAAAEQDATRAETAYQMELSRNETGGREARVLKPAPVPATPRGSAGGALVAGAALAGFLLIGSVSAARPRAPFARDKRLGVLRGGRLDADSAQTVLDAIGIADGRDARVAILMADDPALARSAAAAVAVAALAAGWRPLLVEDPPGPAPAARAQPRMLVFRGAVYLAHSRQTEYGPLDIAAAARRPAEKDGIIDAALAYDLLIFVGRSAGDGDCAARAIRIGIELSDAAATGALARLSIDPAHFAGTILTSRQS